MAEIIIAIILQLVTLTGGQSTTPEQKDTTTVKEKDKKDTPINTQGGTGVWSENGNN